MQYAEEMMHRLRIKFSRDNPLKYISHLDMIRLWERALRRSDVPLAYSQGFTPHPRFTFALPLSVGMTSEGELMDVYLDEAVTTKPFQERVESQLPEGMGILKVKEIPILLLALPSQVCSVQYRVIVDTEKPVDMIANQVKDLLMADSIPIQRVREAKTGVFDLRPWIEELWVISGAEGKCTLGMKLQARPQGGTRPAEVLELLGLGESFPLIHRIQIILEHDLEAPS